MQKLRNAHRIARLALVWFVLSLGIAIASPAVHPQSMQLVCTGAGAMQLLVTGVVSSTEPTQHTLECPLCASIAAPPPAAPSFAGSLIVPKQLLSEAARGVLVSATTAPPQARAPPLNS